MPEDKRALLLTKLGEYEARLTRYETEEALAPPDKNAGFRSPEEGIKIALERKIGTLYKIAIVAALLKTGVVNTWELSRELAEKYGFYEVERFNNACGVVNAYCKGNDAALIPAAK